MNAPALNLNGKRCSGTVFLCTHMSTLCWNSRVYRHTYMFSLNSEHELGTEPIDAGLAIAGLTVPR